MNVNKNNDETPTKNRILDNLEGEIVHAYAILNNLELCIKNERYYSSPGWQCKLELQRAHRQIDALNSENKLLRKRNHELKLFNEELMRYRTPDAYMDAVSTALALFPISSASKVYEETGIQYKTIKKAAKRLGIVSTKEERQEARQRMKDCGLDDIEKRGGKNKRAVEMLVNGKVEATFDSVSNAGKATNNKNIFERIKVGNEINGVLFRYKE